jgi:hypothetical protein
MEITDIEKRRAQQIKYNNAFRAKRSQEERQKDIDYAKKYNDAHKEERKEYQKIEIFCDACQKNYRKCKRSKHLNCKMHLRNEEKLYKTINIEINTNATLCDAA